MPCSARLTQECADVIKSKWHKRCILVHPDKGAATDSAAFIKHQNNVDGDGDGDGDDDEHDNHDVVGDPTRSPLGHVRVILGKPL
eukprot:4026056-Karenia_brevis.AAC.1